MARALTELSNQLQSTVQDELESGERIMWLQQPQPWVFIRAALPAVLFAIPWTAFAVFWMHGASAGGTGFMLFGLPFVLVGLGMLASPLWGLRLAKRTVYVVTDRRAIVFVGGLSTAVRSFDAEELDGYTKNMRAGGAGDLIFGPDYNSSGNSQQRSRTWQNGFFGLPDAREGERFIKALIARGKLLPDLAVVKMEGQTGEFGYLSVGSPTRAHVRG